MLTLTLFADARVRMRDVFRLVIFRRQRADLCFILIHGFLQGLFWPLRPAISHADLLSRPR